jgi:hypothetical protein
MVNLLWAISMHLKMKDSIVKQVVSRGGYLREGGG